MSEYELAVFSNSEFGEVRIITRENGHERFKATGKASNGYQRIRKFHDLIDDDEFQKALLLEATTNKSVVFELKKIQKAITKLINDMGK